MAIAFLSYRHESDAHRDRVRALAARLEGEGLTVVLDQFAQARQFHGGGPDEGWPRWSKQQAGNPAHKVLIIASLGWFQCYEGKALPGTMLGAAAEAGVIEQRLYNTQGISPDIRIVCFDPVDPLTLPLDLQRYHRFESPRDLADLVSWLNGTVTGIPAPSAFGWPHTAPSLAWPVADHSDARVAFAELITSGSKHRMLPIKGVSETGKSLLTKQILRNALKMPGLACGRLDFKGTDDMANAVSLFVPHLKVEPPPASLGLSGQLGKILSDLAARARPTLLVFDTFELAGEAGRWMRDSLLPRLSHADWLRVVIAGQTVPRCHNEPYSDYCAPVIELTPPSPDDWYEYGLEHKRPGITLELVRQIHTLCEGKSALLSQMLGPAA